ncbi:class I SAM-dependent methyltransferase [Cytobacillus firmus]|uniref:class I SAM-dependent methyltransferase n=1 Tax=Cytobacillus firmus TaxID=1399 RepID=UPI002228278F|nr:class I SAM-dependent methyltransferase [Cytobacillus firmus]
MKRTILKNKGVHFKGYLVDWTEWVKKKFLWAGVKNELGRNIYGSFRDMWDLSYPSQELIAFIATISFPKETAGLDVGSGAGREAVFLAQHGLNMIGVDLMQKLSG